MRTTILFLVLLGFIHSAVTPVFIAELWRHGARSTGKNTMKEAYVTRMGPGNIQGNGERMHFILGRQIRADYPQLFTATPSYKDYLVYATHYQRTILSAYSHLMGLFPEGTGMKISAKEQDATTYKYITPPFAGLVTKSIPTEFALPNGIRVMPIHVLQKSTDRIFVKEEEDICPVGWDKTKELFKKNIKEKTPYLKKVSESLIKAGFDPKPMFGSTGYDLRTLGYFSDMAKCRENFNGNGKSFENLPKFVKDKVEDMFGVFYINFRYNNPEMVKVYTSEMTKKIIETMESVISKKSELKYLGLSGHEANLVPFMLLYKLSTEECMWKRIKEEPAEKGVKCMHSPHFAANLIWELAKDDAGQYLVKVKYDGAPIRSCATPLSNDYCKFKDFKEFMLKEFTLSKEAYHNFCFVKTDGKEESGPGVYMKLAMGLGIFAVIQILVKIYLWKKIQAKKENLNI